MILEEFKLDGEVALLTCRGRNWAKDLGRGLAEAGARVVIAATEKAIENDISDMSDLKDNLIVLPADLTSYKAVQRMVDETVSRFGALDILVNNMNVEFAKPFLETTDSEMARVMDANLSAATFCCQAAGRHMVERRHGRIINIVSGAGVRGLANASTYCTSMGGLVQLTRALALEWARKDVRVNAVGIGWMADSFGGVEGDLVSRYVPMGRRGSAPDIAPLVVFLASEASSYLSGHVYFIDGGLMARA